jgi:hypothetical protein
MLVTDHLDAQDPEHAFFRTNLLFCLFSKCAPADWVGPSLRLVRSLRKDLPEAFGFVGVGTRSTSFGKLTDAKWARLEKEIDGAGEKDGFFRSCGPTMRAPDYALLWSVRTANRHENYPGAHLLQIAVPMPATADQTARWEDLFRRIAGGFPFDTGYASPALVCTDEMNKVRAGEVIAPLALRFPGFDVPNNQWTAAGIGVLSRGARWLSFLSDRQAAKLDPQMLSAPPEGVRVDQEGGMLVVRSSPEIQLGDVNRNQWPDGLPWVAELLRPVTRFDDQYLLNLFRKDPALVSRWEHRFLGEP